VAASRKLLRRERHPLRMHPWESQMERAWAGPPNATTPTWFATQLLSPSLRSGRWAGKTVPAARELSANRALAWMSMAAAAEAGIPAHVAPPHPSQVHAHKP